MTAVVVVSGSGSRPHHAVAAHTPLLLPNGTRCAMALNSWGALTPLWEIEERDFVSGYMVEPIILEADSGSGSISLPRETELWHGA